MSVYKRKTKIGDSICINCGNNFYNPTAVYKSYCSDTCKMLGIRKKQRLKHIPKNKDKINKLCIICNKEFKTNRSNKKLCSIECSKVYWYNKQNKEDYCLTHNLYLKTRFEIFKRDNFTCQYCGRNVKEDKVRLHLDHIIPRAKGGKDEVSNYTTSCFECNEGKKDILLEQRMLNKENKK